MSVPAQSNTGTRPAAAAVDDRLKVVTLGNNNAPSETDNDFHSFLQTPLPGPKQPDFRVVIHQNLVELGDEHTNENNVRTLKDLGNVKSSTYASLPGATQLEEQHNTSSMQGEIIEQP